MNGRYQQGVTLVELVITIVIISVAVAGVVGAFSLIAGRSADPLWQVRSIELGQAYLDEILAHNFDNATPPGGVPAFDGACNVGADGESRGSYNDVDDFDGLADEPPRLINQGMSPAYENYRVEVSVSCAGDEVGVADSQAKRIDVTVTAPGQAPMLFSAYKGNY